MPAFEEVISAFEEVKQKIRNDYWRDCEAVYFAANAMAVYPKLAQDFQDEPEGVRLMALRMVHEVLRPNRATAPSYGLVSEAYGSALASLYEQKISSNDRPFGE